MEASRKPIVILFSNTIYGSTWQAHHPTDMLAGLVASARTPCIQTCRRDRTQIRGKAFLAIQAHHPDDMLAGAAAAHEDLGRRIIGLQVPAPKP